MHTELERKDMVGNQGTSLHSASGIKEYVFIPIPDTKCSTLLLLPKANCPTHILLNPSSLTKSTRCPNVIGRVQFPLVLFHNALNT